MRNSTNVRRLQKIRQPWKKKKEGEREKRRKREEKREGLREKWLKEHGGISYVSEGTTVDLSAPVDAT